MDDYRKLIAEELGKLNKLLSSVIVKKHGVNHLMVKQYEEEIEEMKEKREMKKEELEEEAMKEMASPEVIKERLDIEKKAAKRAEEEKKEEKVMTSETTGLANQ